MSPTRVGLGIAFLCGAFSAAVGCSSNKAPGTGGGTTSSTSSGSSTSTTSSTSTSTSTSSGSGTGGDSTVAECGACLDTKCKAEKAACTSDCYSIQACLDAVCYNLSILGSADEGACQTYCEDQYPAGKSPLLAYVNCAASQPMTADAGLYCTPPCAGAPYDYEQCAAQQTAGACSSARAACTASSDCKTYEACSAACTSFSACQACGSGASGMAGEQLFQALQLCIDKACLAEEWLPHF